MFHKFDLFEDVVDKQTLKIKNYDLAFKLKRHLGHDSQFNAYESSRDRGILDYVSSMRAVREFNHKPSLLSMAIKLLKNDLPIKVVSDITGFDFEFVEKLDLFYSDTQGIDDINTELRYEIAEFLLESYFFTDEEIAEKTKLTIKEVEKIKDRLLQERDTTIAELKAKLGIE